ncbi:MAG: undecaprenyldiphospho-muramoylpentapeptide beta-N-acetylglucosaminyltransferase [Candidatus Omnitrophica bacterium]|nr:undecaprenyldiphospho-muramoylpentapeptide beta-N-acetylglucosaminyltransferase [Candidatus Omnitrophota bacterium]
MKVLIASGGSGGHIFPAVALAREVKKDNTEIIFVASRRRLDNELLKNEPCRKIFLSANPMPYAPGPRSIVFLLKLLLDSIRAVYILLKTKPDIVVGFGGYTSGAITLLAARMGIKTVIHEQNMVPGRTNKLLDRIVDAVAVSFQETAGYLRNKNVVFTGNPLRMESLVECREEALQKFAFSREKLTILIMGGSQGASSLNRLIADAIAGLPDRIKQKIQLLHITGAADCRKYDDFYRERGMKARVFAFIASINEAYSACDVAISRAGAAAIFELAAFAKPMILVPYPNLKNNQHRNAVFFAEKNAAVCVNEREITAEKFAGLFAELVENPARRGELARNAKKLSVTDGARRLKEEIVKTLNSCLP